MASVFSLSRLLSQRRETQRRYFEFLRVPALSAGVYALPTGGTDPQQLHHEDEVYYVARGRATLRVGAEDHPVAAGSLIYVPALVPHRFHSIEEELEVLVLFAPAESRPAPV